nr:YciI family protein [Kineosporia sp. R_H_3]
MRLPPRHLDDEEDTMPRFMLLQNFEGGAGCDVPMYEWDPQDVEAHIRFQVDLNAELDAAGELVDAQGLSGPDLAKVVTADGVSAPVVTDGPYLEAKEFLAGYRIVDVDSLDRALEIAARASAAPGAKGAPIQQPIHVRQIMAVPGSDS